MREITAVDLTWTVQGMWSDFVKRCLAKAVKDKIVGKSWVISGTKLKFGALGYLNNGLEIAVAASEGDLNGVARAVTAAIASAAGAGIGDAILVGSAALLGVTNFWALLVIGVIGAGLGGLVAGRCGEEIWDSLSEKHKAALFSAIGLNITLRYSDDPDPDPEDPPKPSEPEESPLPFDPSHYKNEFEDMKNTVSPIALDLDGDGMEFVRDGAYFDYDASGFAEKATWLAKDDGWLVLDRNGDGVVNDGSELFEDVAEFIFRSERRCAAL